MTKHEYLHKMKETYQHIVDAEKKSDQALVLYHIGEAKKLFNFLADDAGVNLANGEID